MDQVRDLEMLLRRAAGPEPEVLSVFAAGASRRLGPHGIGTRASDLAGALRPVHPYARICLAAMRAQTAACGDLGKTCGSLACSLVLECDSELGSPAGGETLEQAPRPAARMKMAALVSRTARRVIAAIDDAADAVPRESEGSSNALETRKANPLVPCTALVDLGPGAATALTAIASTAVASSSRRLTIDEARAIGRACVGAVLATVPADDRGAVDGTWGIVKTVPIVAARGRGGMVGARASAAARRGGVRSPDADSTVATVEAGVVLDFEVPAAARMPAPQPGAPPLRAYLTDVDQAPRPQIDRGAARRGVAIAEDAWRRAIAEYVGAMIRARVDVVLCQRTIEPELRDALLAEGILPVERLSLRFIDAVRHLTGCTVVSRAWPTTSAVGIDAGGVDPSVVGALGAIEVLRFAGRAGTALRPVSAREGRVVTVLAAQRPRAHTGSGGLTPEDAIAASVAQGIGAVRAAVRQRSTVLAGGGCWALAAAEIARCEGCAPLARAFDRVATLPCPGSAPAGLTHDVVAELDDHGPSQIDADPDPSAHRSVRTCFGVAAGIELDVGTRGAPRSAGARSWTAPVMRVRADNGVLVDGTAVDIGAHVRSAIAHAAEAAITVLRAGIVLPSAILSDAPGAP